jgi:DNA-binding transcriptional ArsR family regulator
MNSDRELLSSDDGVRPSSVLVDPRQRRILSLLLDASGPVTVDELAARLTATEEEMPDRQLQIDLHHRCLPRLEEIGWIEWDGSKGVTVESLPFGTEATSLPPLDALDDQSWTAIGVLLGCPRRRELLSTIVEQRHQLTIDELTTALTARNHTVWDEYEEATIHVMLYHIDLPKLADVGLIEYNPDEQWITRTRLLMRLADRINFDRALMEN